MGDADEKDLETTVKDPPKGEPVAAAPPSVAAPPAPVSAPAPTAPPATEPPSKQEPPASPTFTAATKLARCDDLARLVHAAAFSAASERRPALDAALDELQTRYAITDVDAKTSFGDALRPLRSTAGATAPERALAGALLARGLALEPRVDGSEDRVTDALLWIASATPIDPWPFVDDALGDRADGLWQSIGGALQRGDEGVARLTRGQAIVGAAALAESRSPVAVARRMALAPSMRDPLLRRLLETDRAVAAASTGTAVAAGELTAPPRSGLALVVLAVTGILPLLVLGRLLGRFALRIRRPAELRVDATGVTVHARTEMLGRTLRERNVHIPLAGLAGAAREVRFPRLALYAGVVALVAGSYLGLRLFIDGLRAGSVEFLALGAALVVAGLVVDYVLSAFGAVGRGRCNVLFVPRKGSALFLADVDPALADAALLRLAPSTAKP